MQARSQGGPITCTLSPSSGSVLAEIDPVGQATFGEGITYQVCANIPLELQFLAFIVFFLYTFKSGVGARCGSSDYVS